MLKAHIYSGVIFFLGFFLFVPTASATNAIQPKNVLIFLSGEYGLPAYDIMLSGIRTALKKDITGPLNLYAEYLDSSRFPEERYRKKLFELYYEKYGAMKLDLFIAIGPNLTSFIDIFNQQIVIEHPTILLDFVEVFVPVPAIFHKPNMTGIYADVDIKKAVALALLLHPDTEEIYVVGGSSTMDRGLIKLARAACQEYEDTVKVNYITEQPITKIRQRVSTLPEKSIVLLTTMQMDSEGVPYYPKEGNRLISAASIAPVYVLFDTHLDQDVVGGYVISYKQVGIVVGNMALRILHGEKPEDIPFVRKGIHQYIFDWHQLKRWGIPEHRLPEGSVILNKQKGFCEEHKWQITGICLFLAFQSAFIGYLIVLNRKEKNLSAQLISSEGRYRELLRFERISRLGEMTASLAHELNQPLAAIQFNAQAALRFLKTKKTDDALFREILQGIVLDNKRASAIIHALRSMLKKEDNKKQPIIMNDIVYDVILILNNEIANDKISIETHLDGSIPLVMGNKVQLQQVVLNLIMNAAESVSQYHETDRRKIIVQTSILNGSVQTSVSDFGPGIDDINLNKVFEPFVTTKNRGVGMGLAVCKTIVMDHGGDIQAKNAPEGGATFTFTLTGVNND